MRKTISLPKELVENAKKVADRTGATFSGLIRISLKREIENEQENEENNDQVHS